jgi:hypothetical protein
MIGQEAWFLATLIEYVARVSQSWTEIIFTGEDKGQMLFLVSMIGIYLIRRSICHTACLKDHRIFLQQYQNPCDYSIAQISVRLNA